MKECNCLEENLHSYLFTKIEEEYHVQWFIPKCLQYLELGQFKVGSQEFNPVSIMSGRDKITAATSMLRCLSVGGWIQEVRLKFRLSRVGCEHPWQPCKRYDTCPSQLIFLLLFFHEVHLTSVFLFSICTKESFSCDTFERTIFA